VLLAIASLVALTAGTIRLAQAQTTRPSPPAAASTVVGAETCAGCHDAVAAQFSHSAHGDLAAFERRGQPAGCESCHGPGGKHAESGDPTDILGFADRPAASVNSACQTCHRGDHAMAWAGSAHAMSDLTCINCHRIHQSREVVAGPRAVEGTPPPHANAPAAKGSLVKRESELCYGCHNDMRAKFSASSHHPVREGKMTCSSCHEVHGTGQQNALLKTDERKNDLCYRCHSTKQGPFMFEHAPVDEDCMTCHDPHGAISNNLLKQGEPFLCLQCHEMHFHNARLSPNTPFSLPAGGSTNPNGASGFMRAFGTRCTNCHTKIHGSDLPSQGVTGGGKALTR
jgi:predicted CXXCH cytochrome family protein